MMADGQQLASILSGDPLPTPPPQEDVEQDRFNRNVISYLRRLQSRFTAENLEGTVPTVGVEEMSAFFKVANMTGNTNLTLAQSAYYASTINEFTLLATADNSALMFVLIDGVEATGTGVRSIDTTERTFTFTGANTVAVGAKIELEIQGSMITDPFIAITLKRTRT